MQNQMVSRFRVKKLSPKHPLPIFKESQLPDIGDAVNIQRSVPQIETGVEKEEEEEHDLQAAISAAHAAVTTGAKVATYIPTPDASRVIPDPEYHLIYQTRMKKPTALIRFSSTVEDCIGCPYVMDEEDDAFLKKYNDAPDTTHLSEDDFEKVMWLYESNVNQHWPHLDVDASQIPSFADLQNVIPSDDYPIQDERILETVYGHWKTRRGERNGDTIFPQLRYEDKLKNEIDPYVCFRRREQKPVRKTRRTDQQSLERLRKLRTEMESARNLLEMVLRREKIRKEGLVLEHAVFEKRCKLREFQRQLGIKEDEDLMPVSKKKRKTSLESGSSGATIKIPLNKLKRDGFDIRQEKNPLQLAIQAELARKQEQDAGYEDVTECPYQPFPSPLPLQFYQTLNPQAQKAQPRYRKRIGRGGRVFIDRAGLHTRKRHLPESLPTEAEPVFDRYRFDDSSDEDGDDEEPVEVDEMDSTFLRHATQLLSDTELRSLITIPFLTPRRPINHSTQSPSSVNNTPSSTTTSQVGQPTPASTPSSSPALNHLQNGRPNAVSPLPMKRQNSRTKMTPQQAAVAMANGMIAANMAAVVNGGQSKAMQMAMAAAHQQQPSTSPSLPQTSPHLSS